MDHEEFKKQVVTNEFGLTADYGNIMVFLDFGNINYWFEADNRDENGGLLDKSEKLGIDLGKLYDFTAYFSDHARFYYGHNRNNQGSLGFIGKAKIVFGKRRVFTKELQKIRHHLSVEELETNIGVVNHDLDGAYIYLYKCNFDVEMTVDAIRLADKYDTICLFSGDADFASLNTYLRNIGKKVIIVKAGHILHTLASSADLVINAQDIKKYITFKKQKSS